MPPEPAALVAGLAAGLIVAVVAGPVLRSLPEPADPEDKPTYASLARARVIAPMAVAAGLASTVAAGCLPAERWAPWLVFAVAGALAAGVDAATTWIPRRLTAVLGSGLAVALVATASLHRDPVLLLGAAATALALRAFFYLFYLPAGGIGFADVRLATAIGALTGAHSVELTLAAVLAGTLLGAGWGVLHRALRGSGPFAYGPALWAGPFLGLLWLSL